ncbi:hypothetical protein [Rhodococcus sp. 14-2483-1-1]|uniref:hypothetical protein n=1 Tax=Rhodococcus sp. 14-2483-1-1 TaxID=2023148 RepID=UPI001481D922|nr:hypothetical protein [Rhodococcus sp. 14-2483-1-1]
MPDDHSWPTKAGLAATTNVWVRYPISGLDQGRGKKLERVSTVSDAVGQNNEVPVADGE